MQMGEWYQWGEPITGVWANDGAMHTIKATMRCLTYGYPSYCPSANAPEDAAQLVVTMPQYAITPSMPYIWLSGAWHNYTVNWGCDANAVAYTLQQNVNGWGWYDVLTETTATSYTPNHFAYEPGTIISYRVIARSSTYNTSMSLETAPFYVGGGVKIKVDGVWRSGTVYVKADGVWRKADYASVKADNVWKISDY
jgi:hypothetical protein